MREYPNDHILLLHIPKPTWDELKEIAKGKGISVTKLINLTVVDMIREEQGKEEEQ